jgi:hypothetical protein
MIAIAVQTAESSSPLLRVAFVALAGQPRTGINCPQRDRL